MYTLIGVVTGSHGIKGQVKVYPYTDFPDRFKILKRVFVGEEKMPLNIEEVKYIKNFVLLKFKEFDNINEILNLKNKEIFILSSERIKLKQNQFYISDLIGSKVYDEEENYLGELVEVILSSANDVYRIKNKNIEGMVPAVKEFIKNIDLENKEITIKKIEGMFYEN